MNNKKQCKVCRKVKPLHAYRKDSELLYGRENTCWVCVQKRDIPTYDKEAWINQTGEYAPKSTAHEGTSVDEPTKECAKCGHHVPVSKYYKDNSRKDRLQRMCKTCAKSISKKQYDKSRDTAKDVSDVNRDIRTRLYREYYKLVEKQMTGKLKDPKHNHVLDKRYKHRPDDFDYHPELY